MAKYNLIKNSILRSITTDSYNKELSSTELYNLMDDNITTTGVTLTDVDNLCLEVDLGQRLKIDGIFLYADDLTKQSNITFQYKNYEEEAFTTCVKSVSATYNATIPEPSAPRFIRCTVSGVNLSLYELKVLNNDYIIEFGEDGQETGAWLDSTPIGILGIPQGIEIYNNTDNSDFPANAYVCVDHTGTGNDSFVKISKYEEGPYLGFEDGSVTGYSYLDWNSGVYDNITYDPSNNSIKLNY